MKRLSKITESTWGDMRKRAEGVDIRREDGKKVHTCLGVDITIREETCDYDKWIKEFFDKDPNFSYGVCILNIRDKSYSTEEIANMRKFEAPYAFMIYDGGHGTDLIAEFYSYSEFVQFEYDGDESSAEICEADYMTICRAVATKLKEVGGDLHYVHRRYDTIGKQNINHDYYGDFALQLIDENTVHNWECDYSEAYGDVDPYIIHDYKSDMIDNFPELKNVDFLTWTFRDGVNIALPFNFDNVMNFNKYKEYTESWFTVDEEAE